MGCLTLSETMPPKKAQKQPTGVGFEEYRRLKPDVPCQADTMPLAAGFGDGRRVPQKAGAAESFPVQPRGDVAFTPLVQL
jgi:hypothetical protein